MKSDYFRRITLAIITIPFLTLPVLGSFNTVLYFVAAGIGLLLFLFARMPLIPMHHVQPDNDQKKRRIFFIIYIIFAAYYLHTGVLSVLVHYEGDASETRYMVHDLGFLVLPFLMLLCRPDPDSNIMKRTACCAALGGIVAIGMGIYQLSVMNHRPEGGMGNPLIFAYGTAILMFLSVVSIGRSTKKEKALMLVGCLCLFGCVLLSEGRSVLISLVIISVFLIFYYYLKHKRDMWAGMLAVSTFILCVVVSAYSYSPIKEKFVQLEIEGKLSNEVEMVNTSIGTRFLYLKYGWKVFTEHPLFGVGPQHRMQRVYDAMPEPVKERFRQEQSDTHLHNQYITTLVGTGLIGAILLLLVYASPLMIAIMSQSIQPSIERLYMGFVTSFITIGVAFTNLTFGHDLSNIVFLFIIVLLLVDVERDVSQQAEHASGND